LINAGAGLSSSTDASAAADEVAKKALDPLGGTRPDFGLLFTTGHFAEFNLPRRFSQIVGIENLAGCTGYGVLSLEGEVEGRPGMAALLARSDGIIATPFAVPVGDPDLVGDQIADLLPEVERGSLMILLPDAHSVEAGYLIDQLSLRYPQLPVVGAASANSRDPTRTYQFRAGESFTHAVAGVLLSGKMRFAIGVTQACQPFSDPLEVTRCEGRKVYELGGRKASGVLQLAISGFRRKAMGVIRGPIFAGLSIDPKEPFRSGNYVVRHIVGVDEKDGSITVAGNVEEGQEIAFVVRDPESAIEDLYRMVEDVKGRLGKLPSLGLYFDCLARGSSLYSIPDRDVGAIREVLGEIPLVGFHGNYELAPVDGVNLVHTYTGVLVLIAER